MLKIILAPEAVEDLKEIARYIGELNTDASLRFTDFCFRTFDLISMHPQLGPLARFKDPAIEELRMLPVPQYRQFLIIYRVSEASIDIVRVVNGAQDLFR